jgi:excisionase family DNA binding protein
MDREMLRVDEVAALLKFGRTKVYQLVADGDLPAVRIGKALRISAESLRDWIREQAVANPGGRN